MALRSGDLPRYEEGHLLGFEAAVCRTPFLHARWRMVQRDKQMLFLVTMASQPIASNFPATPAASKRHEQRRLLEGPFACQTRAVT